MQGQAQRWQPATDLNRSCTPTVAIASRPQASTQRELVQGSQLQGVLTQVYGKG